MTDLGWVLCDSYDCPIERHDTMESALWSLGLRVTDLEDPASALAVSLGGGVGAYAGVGEDVYEANTHEGSFVIRRAVPEDRVRRG